MEHLPDQLLDMAEPDGSSHIVLESPDAEHSFGHQPKNVAARLKLDSRIRGAYVDLILYEEGFLEVREQYRHRRGIEKLLDLRYLDPRPKISRIVAPRLAYAALGLGGLTGVLGVLAWYRILTVVTLPAALLFGSAAATYTWLLLCRTGEKSVFHTATGRADVLTLFGTIGSIAALRRIVPVLATAIRGARDSNSDDKHLYLRQEIREHYRLAEYGIISRENCGACTQRILKEFD